MLTQTDFYSPDIIFELISMLIDCFRNRETAKNYIALTEIFNRADVSKDGKISIEEYVDICREYGIEVAENELQNVKRLANKNGKMSKNDFIMYVKTSNLFKSFLTVDTESEFHWKRKVDLAWKLFDKNQDGYVTQ